MKKSKLYVFGDSFTTTSGLSFMEYYYRLNKRPSELYIKEYDPNILTAPLAEEVAPFHWKAKVADNLGLELVYKGGDARGNYDILNWYLQHTDDYTDDDVIVVALSDPRRFLVPNLLLTELEYPQTSDGAPRGYLDSIESYHPHMFLGHGYNIDEKISKAYNYLCDTVYLNHSEDLNRWWYTFAYNITRLSKGKVFMFNSNIWPLFPSMKDETNGKIDDYIHWGKVGNDKFAEVLTYCIENSITELSTENIKIVKNTLYGEGSLL